MLNVLPFAIAVDLIFQILFFISFTVLVRRPVVNIAEFILVASPIDPDFMLIVIICAFNKVCPSCKVEGVLAAIVLKVVDFDFPKTISETTALTISILCFELDGRHEVVSHWADSCLLVCVLERGV